METIKKMLIMHYEERRSGRAIARQCGVSRMSVARCLKRFRASGLAWPDARDMDAKALEAALYPTQGADRAQGDVDWSEVETKLKRQELNLRYQWEEWIETHPDGMSYQTWCRRFNRWKPSDTGTMHIERRPGERLFVDFAGRTVPIYDGTSPFRAHIFVAAMGVSGFIYARALRSQKVEDWCTAHIHCFEAMGRAPQVVVPDNLKSAVIKPDRYEPVLNTVYKDLLDHYEIACLPARVRSPRDKALVEQAVRYVQSRVLAPLCTQHFFDLDTLNEAIETKIETLNARRYSDGSGETRRLRFDTADKPAMRPLPSTRWQPMVWRKNKVHPDYHIVIDRNRYSVPYHAIGKTVDVCIRGQVVTIYYQSELIARHVRLIGINDRSTHKEHQPKAHQRVEVTARCKQLRGRAQAIGEHVDALIAAIFDDHPQPELGFRTCYGILRLASGTPHERLNAACRYALENGTLTYGGLASILETNADLCATEVDDGSAEPIMHKNIRGAKAFK